MKLLWLSNIKVKNELFRLPYSILNQLNYWERRKSFNFLCVPQNSLVFSVHQKMGRWSHKWSQVNSRYSNTTSFIKTDYLIQKCLIYFSSINTGWAKNGLKVDLRRKTWLIRSSTWASNLCLQPRKQILPWISSKAWPAGWERWFPIYWSWG